MRIFLDTNVLVSAFTTRGLCEDVLREVLSSHDLIVSVQLFEELERTIQQRDPPTTTIQSVTSLLSCFGVQSYSQRLHDSKDGGKIRTTLTGKRDLRRGRCSLLRLTVAAPI